MRVLWLTLVDKYRVFSDGEFQYLFDENDGFIEELCNTERWKWIENQLNNSGVLEGARLKLVRAGGLASLTSQLPMSSSKNLSATLACMSSL